MNSRPNIVCRSIAKVGESILMNGAELLVIAASPTRLTVRNCGYDYVTTVKRGI